MPSVPQSLLWISLVVLWLFVLVPMLISKRDAVRRTSDVALATRVLNSAGARKSRRGPAAGHRSDPDWQPAEDLDDELDSEEIVPQAAVVTGAETGFSTEEPDYLDVDVVEEDSGALPVVSRAAIDEPEDAVGERAVREEVGEDQVDEEPVGEEPVGEDEGLVEEEQPVSSGEDDTEDEYEYVEDTSGLEAEDEPPSTVSPTGSRRRMYESKTAAVVSARKYRFRKRTVSLMVLMLAVSAVAAFTVWPEGKWLCAAAGAITMLYLAYLRRQTRIEQRLRRRRVQRMARSRLGVENAGDRDFDLVPSRLRRPGAVVLEIDEEDPIFEHLDDASVRTEYHLPRAAGQ
ncbi:MAG: hypothetical protein JO044_16570 [Mycobacteriaceae bacterium]|nr:hypothetical protein [Mycobacteriaceae bacterium]MBV9638779.1 hypothetical protein [Mycobacteriaceae bacterium]